MSSVRQHPLLVFLVHMTQSILLRKIAYLKAENDILRTRLPKQIRPTTRERAVLVRLGAPLGNAIQELLSAVYYKTFLRWVREEKAGKLRTRKPMHLGAAPDWLNPAKIECDSKLGRLLRHYHRRAARNRDT